MRTTRGILDYCRLREDIDKATIREIRFRLEPYTFCLKEMWCLGLKQNCLAFCKKKQIWHFVICPLPHSVGLYAQKRTENYKTICQQQLNLRLYEIKNYTLIRTKY